MTLLEKYVLVLQSTVFSVKMELHVENNQWVPNASVLMATMETVVVSL